MNKISLGIIRAARAGMTAGKYGIRPGVRLQGDVVVEIDGRPHQVAMMTGDAPAADPTCPHLETQPGRNALGFAANHIDKLLDIADAARAYFDQANVQDGARAFLDLQTALTKVTQ